MSQVNAVKYAAGYVIKSVLDSHKCVECSHFLLNSESVPKLSADVFFHFKLFEHCNICLVFMCHLMLRYIFSQNVGTSLRKMSRSCCMGNMYAITCVSYLVQDLKTKTCTLQPVA